MLAGDFSPRLVLNVIDAVLVALIAYWVFTLIRGTRAVQVLKGLLVLGALTGVSRWLHLGLLSWILDKVWTVAFVAVVVIFQPEIRRLLEKLGQGAPLLRMISGAVSERVIEQVAAAVRELAQSRTGALIVFQRETGLNDLAEGGVLLDALVSKELLLAIFSPQSALHDGALIIRGDRVVAARCFLPLASQALLPSYLGSRHRAAVGLAEQTDALVVVVSEQTGQVSLAVEGKLERLAALGGLEALLTQRLREKGQNWGKTRRKSSSAKLMQPNEDKPYSSQKSRETYQ